MTHGWHRPWLRDHAEIHVQIQLSEQIHGIHDLLLTGQPGGLLALQRGRAGKRDLMGVGGSYRELEAERASAT